jgi:hypothetical protein
MSRLSVLLLLVLLAGCGAPRQAFTLGAPETIISQQQFTAAGVRGVDASIYAVADKDDAKCKWFFTNRFKLVHTIGPKANPMAKVVVNGGDIQGLPDAYKDTRLGFEVDRRWGNASWIANVYRDPKTGHILGFVHLEHHAQDRGEVYFRFGLAISKDGGRTFDWCGYILEPDLSYKTWHDQWSPKNLKGHHAFANTGLANYVIADGYFYLYYTDTKESSEEFINGAAVARAKIADVMSAAGKLQTTPWKKHHNGAWSSPGMGGEFTALNIKPLGYLHGDAAYNSHARKFVMVTRTGKVRPEGGRGRFSSIVISFSRDGIVWSDWKPIHGDNHLHDYPSIVSLGADNEVTGKSFWVYYKYFYDSVLPEIHWGKNRWDRVLVTLE